MTVITVPSDGSCVLHSIALAYLDPTSHEEEFQRRFQQLFGSEFDDDCNVLYQQFAVNAIDANLYKKITTSNVWQNLIYNFRVRLVNFMELHSVQLDIEAPNPLGYISNNINFHNTKSFTEYLAVIIKPREWLGALEIYSASLLLECCIILQQEHKIVATFNKQFNPVLELEFVEDKKHYNFILKCFPLSTQKRKLPITETEFIEATSTTNSVSQNFKRVKLDKSVGTYDASGVKRALHGTIYQLELLMLFLMRIRKLSEVFFLATEMDVAEKFDDIVLKYKVEGSKQYKCCFLQAKHKEDTEKYKITTKELASSKNYDFSLQKYFVSFYKIKTNDNFQDSELEDFCILTNTTFDLEIDKKDNKNIKELKKKWSGLFSEYRDLRDDQILDVNGDEKQIRFKQDKSSLDNLGNTIKTSLKQAISTINIKKSKVKNLLVNSTIVPDKIKEQIKSSIKDDLSDTVLNKILLIEEKLRKYNKKIPRDQFFLLADDILELHSSSQLAALREELSGKKIISQEQKEKFLKQLNEHLNNFIQEMTNINDWLISTNSNDSPVKLRDLKDAFENFDTYFNEFISKLRFVVNYPNVDALNLKISLEIGADENLLTPDLFAHSFEKVMLDWLKQKEGVFLTEKERYNIFHDIQEQIQALKISGLSKAYPEKLNSYEISFKQTLPCVSSFLQDKNVSVLHLISAETQLTSIKLLEALKELRSELAWLKYDDSFIFIPLALLVLPEIRNIALNSFASKLKSHNLFIIECSMDNVSDECTRLGFKLQEEMRKDSSKKLICIGKQDDNFIKELRKISKLEYPDRTIFNDLDENSQEKLLTKQILFQGKNVELGQVIDNTLATHLIDESLLIKLITNDSVVVIGDNLKTHFNYNSYYYMTRRLQYQKLNKSVLNAGIHLFISNISEEQLTKLVVNRENLCNIKNFNYAKSIIFTESNDKTRNECYFNELCNKSNVKSFHWIIFSKGSLIWSSSNGVVENILKYVDQESESIIFEDYVLTEDEYFGFPHITKNLIILADNPGMGKSMLLTSVALKTKEINPHWFVSVINLNEYSSLSHPYRLKNITFDDDDLDAAVDYCSSMILSTIQSTENSFVKRLFKTSLLTNDSQQNLNIILLFDGFDEIAPTYKNQTIKLFKALQKTNIKQFWISTRLHVKNFLEKELNFPALLLNHFRNCDKILFLNKYLKWHLKYREENLEDALNNLAAVKTFDSDITDNNDSLNIFVQDILNLLKRCSCLCSIEYRNYLIDSLDPSVYSWILLFKWQKAVTRRNEDITSNPLHLKMLADITFRRIIHINENFSILTLYETFVNSTFDIFFNDKQTMGDVLSGKMMEISSSMNYKKIHQELAQDFFFSHKNIKLRFSYLQNEVDNFTQYKYESEKSKITVEEVLVHIGLVFFNSSMELNFIHATFAEYFLFEWIINNLKEEQVQEILVKTILIDDDYSLICEFFELYLSTNTDIKSCIFTEKIINNLAKHNVQTDLNNSILHLTTMRDHSNILNFILDRFENYDKKYLKKILIATNNRNQTALEVANLYTNATCFQKLFNLYSRHSSESLYSILVSIIQNSYTILEEAERRNDILILKMIILFAKDKFNLENFKRLLLTPIRTIYCKHNRLGTFNILHLMVHQRQKANLEFLLNELKDYPVLLRRLLLDKEFGNTYMTPFYFALVKNYVDMVNLFFMFLQERPRLLNSVLLQSDNEGNIIHPKILKNTETLKYFVEALGKYLSPSEYASVFSTLLLSCNNEKETLLFVMFNQKMDNEVLTLLLKEINHEVVCEDMLLISVYSKGMPIETQYQFLEWFALYIKETAHNCNVYVLEMIKNIQERIPLIVKESIDLTEKIMSLSSCTLNNIFYADELCRKLLQNKQLLLAVNVNRYINFIEFLLQNPEAEIQKAILNYLRNNPYLFRTIVLDADLSGTILHKLTIKNNIEQIKTLFNYLNKYPNITDELILKVNQIGEMATHFSVRNNNMEILELILNQTVYQETLTDLIFATNQENQNILEIAVEHMDENITNLILIFIRRFRTDDILDLILGTYKHTENIISFAFQVSTPKICSILLDYIRKYFDISRIKNIFLGSNYLPTLSADSHGNLLFSVARQSKYLVLDILWKYAKIIFDDFNELRAFIISTDPYQNNFLHTACSRGNYKNIKYFFEELTEFLDLGLVISLVSAKDYLLKMTPIHMAVLHNQFEPLKVLLSFCEKNITNSNPILIRKLLLSQDVSGCTPLLLAIEKNSLKCFLALLDLAKSLEIKQTGVLKELLFRTNIKGRTVLHDIILEGEKDDVLKALINVLEKYPNNLDELVKMTDNNGETILHLGISDSQDLGNLKFIFSKLKNETIVELITKENNFGLTPLHKAFWNCNSAEVLMDNYVRFILDKINRRNWLDQTFSKLQRVSIISQEFEDAIKKEDEARINKILVDYGDCLKELFLRPITKNSSFLTVAYETSNTHIVRIILEKLKLDSNLLKNVLLNNSTELIFLVYHCEFELFHLVLKYVKSINDEEFYQNYLLKHNLILGLKIGKRNKKTRELLKKETNKIADTLLNNEEKIQLRRLRFNCLQTLKNYIESSEYNGPSQERFTNAINSEILRRENTA